MENSNLNARLLDTSIKTMERNRALLFTINLIAALVLVVVYLDRWSFDTQQREAHLIAFQEWCETLNESLQEVPKWNEVSQDRRDAFSGCSDLDGISAFVVSNARLPLFRADDLKDPAGLAAKLRDAKDPLSQYLRGRLYPETQHQLEQYDGSDPQTEILRKALVDEFNHLLRNSDLYDAQRFAQAKVALSEETREQVNQKLSGNSLLRFNRALLEEAYPHEIVKNVDSNLLQEISRSVFRLRVIKNDMADTKLDTANVAPLGFGLPVPRNDLVIICGLLMVILYLWLAFSFAQHARITERIKLLFQESELGEGDAAQASINDLIELNFLFRTSKGWITALFVRTLYLSAPLAMTAANVNDFFPDALQFYRHFIDEIALFPRKLEVIIMLILWVIGICIIISDMRANVEPKSQTTPKELIDDAATGT